MQILDQRELCWSLPLTTSFISDAPHTRQLKKEDLTRTRFATAKGTFPSLYPSGPPVAPSTMSLHSSTPFDRGPSYAQSPVATPTLPALPLAALSTRPSLEDSAPQSDNWDSDFEESVSLSKLMRSLCLPSVLKA